VEVAVGIGAMGILAVERDRSGERLGAVSAFDLAPEPSAILSLDRIVERPLVNVRRIFQRLIAGPVHSAADDHGIRRP